MSPNALDPGPVRPAAAVNEDIRALARWAWGRPFTDEERAAYELLVVEWAAAERAEVVAAARPPGTTKRPPPPPRRATTGAVTTHHLDVLPALGSNARACRPCSFPGSSGGGAPSRRQIRASGSHDGACSE